MREPIFQKRTIYMKDKLAKEGGAKSAPPKFSDKNELETGTYQR